MMSCITFEMRELHLNALAYYYQSFIPVRYKYVEVGQNLKSPELPIWVVCSESHFTVLFSRDARPMRGPPPFELLYYDELANQEVNMLGEGDAAAHVITLTCESISCGHSTMTLCCCAGLDSAKHHKGSSGGMDRTRRGVLWGSWEM